ncbi:hypothetical protein BGW39_001625 [Mortierella sp. 14UC]|nr:hypothetical protein BGW39_001625 [Mortierella sp. 14UC]
MDLKGDTVDPFWKACTIFQEMDYTGANMGISGLLPMLSFPHLKRLSSRSIDPFHQTFHSGRHLAWFRQCPNLMQLHWDLDYAPASFDAFAEAMRQGTWAHLQDLSLVEVSEMDDVLALTFVHLPPLLRFRLQSHLFGWMALESLQRQLFASINILNFSGTYDVSSDMALQVLQECTHLQDFKTARINAEDIDNEERPWACLALKRLNAYVRALEGPKNKPAVTSQGFIRPNGTRALQWNLRSGLSQLATLQNLEVAVFENTPQDMMKEDIDWMAKNFPALRQVHGTSSENAQIKRKLRRLVRKYDIEH